MASTADDTTGEIIKNPEAIKRELEDLLASEGVSNVVVPDVPPKQTQDTPAGQQRHRITPPIPKHVTQKTSNIQEKAKIAEIKSKIPQEPTGSNHSRVKSSISDVPHLTPPSESSQKPAMKQEEKRKGKQEPANSLEKRVSDLEDVVQELGLKILDLSEALDRAVARTARLEEMSYTVSSSVGRSQAINLIASTVPGTSNVPTTTRKTGQLDWARFLKSTPYPGNPRVASAKVKSWAVSQGVKVIIPSKLVQSQYNLEYLSSL